MERGLCPMILAFIAIVSVHGNIFVKAATGSTSGAACRSGYRLISDKCYKYVLTASTYSDAVSACDGDDNACLYEGRDATTLQQIAYASHLSTDQPNFWIGQKYDAAGELLYENGDAEGTTDATKADMCVKTVGTTGGTDAEDCSTTLPYICQYDPLADPADPPLLNHLHDYQLYIVDINNALTQTIYNKFNIK